jgi:hypothetical protein
VRLDEQGRVCWAALERAAGEELQSMARSARGAADRLEAAWAQTYGTHAGQWLFSVRGHDLLEADVQALHQFARRWGRRFGDRSTRWSRPRRRAARAWGHTALQLRPAQLRRGPGGQARPSDAAFDDGA